MQLHCCSRGADFLSGFDKPQRDALVLVFLHMHGQGILANEVFWGLWLFPFGLLLYRSRFLPRILGVWLISTASPIWLQASPGYCGHNTSRGSRFGLSR
jgi:hypothetical protein